MIRKRISVFFSFFSFIFSVISLFSCNVTVTPEASTPIITSVSNDVVTTVNTSIALNVVASVNDGGTLTYNWYSTIDKLTDGTMIDSSENKTLNLNVEEIGTFYYYCVVTNKLGDNEQSIKTPIIVVTVIDVVSALNPVIISMPKQFSGVMDSDFSFDVIAYSPDGGILSYQWYYSKSEDDDYCLIENAIENKFSGKISKETLGFYYCLITNTIIDNGDGGNKKNNKSTCRVQLTNDLINANEPELIKQPNDVEASVTDVKSFSVIACAINDKSVIGHLEYQWYCVDNGQSIPVTDGVTPTIEITVDKILAGKTVEYYCVISNIIPDNGDGGIKCKSISSNKAKLVVSVINADSPIIISNPLDVKSIIPSEEYFSVGAYSPDGGSLTYQWYLVTEGETEGSMITGATNSTYKDISEYAGKKGFYCVVTNTIPDNGDGGMKKADNKSGIAWLETVNLSEVISSPVFTQQPKTICITKNESPVFSCKAEVDNYNVVYRWFETDSNGSFINPIGFGWDSSGTIEIQPYIETGIHYYVCAASSYVPDNDVLPENAVFSNIVAALYTKLPLIKINTINSEEPTADYVEHPAGGYGSTLTNHTKPGARMVILRGSDGSELYDSGEYIKKESGLTIKLRGNTSAYGSKKPYKLKLQKKADLLAGILNRNDNKYKDKEWVLLKDGTSLNTFVGLNVADIAGTEWTPKFAYVNVVMNGEYRGIYMLIEAVSKGEKRVNVGNDGYIIERDAYWWNEEVKFFTNLNQKFTFKYPDSEDITQDQISFINGYMNLVEENVQNGTYENYIDVESFARWQLIHDILGTWDEGGSNIYMTKYDSSSPDNLLENNTWTKIQMSTPWDFDTNYRMENTWSRSHNGARIYSNRLFGNTNPAFTNSFKSQWQILSPTLFTVLQTKLNNLKLDMENDINLSRQCDAFKHHGNYSSVEDDIIKAETWFTNRIIWLDTAIEEL